MYRRRETGISPARLEKIQVAVIYKIAVAILALVSGYLVGNWITEEGE